MRRRSGRGRRDRDRDRRSRRRRGRRRGDPFDDGHASGRRCRRAAASAADTAADGRRTRPDAAAGTAAEAGRRRYGGGDGGYGGRGGGDSGYGGDGGFGGDGGGLSVDMMGGGAGAYRRRAVYDNSTWDGTTKLPAVPVLRQSTGRARQALSLSRAAGAERRQRRRAGNVPRQRGRRARAEGNPTAIRGYRMTEWSEPSPVAIVPQPGLVYVAGAEPANPANFTAEPEAKLLIKSLDADEAAEVALAEYVHPRNGAQPDRPAGADHLVVDVPGDRSRRRAAVESPEFRLPHGADAAGLRRRRRRSTAIAT